MIHKINNQQNDVKWLILRTRIYEEKIKSAFRYFRAEAIEPILIKGWASAIEFPEKHQRIFGDIDLAVMPTLYEKSRILVSTEEGRKFAIDLHRGLRHLDLLQWDDLFEKSVLIDLDGEKIRVLCPEDHLRVLCVHWLNDGGTDKERLLDIYYLLENHREEFDWEKCFRKISPVRKDWIIKTIGVVAKYYQLDLYRMPFSAESLALPKWLIKTLEREWSSETKLIPIHLTLKNRAQLWRQIKKRFPPNPIQATIDMEGKFDESGRLYYQLGSIILRFGPSLKRIFSSFNVRQKSA